jgi:hypothetical protein
VDAEQVAQWLGFVQPISAGRLHRAWEMWKARSGSTSQAGSGVT